MRKALIAAIVAAALFAVGAFAASFGVQAEDVTSGADAVDACAARVDVDFTTSYDATADDWYIDAAVVTFRDDTNALDDGCADHDLTLVLEDEAGVELPQNATYTWDFDTAGQVATFSWADNAGPLASVVGNAALLADGFQLWADVPAP